MDSSSSIDNLSILVPFTIVPLAKAPESLILKLSVVSCFIYDLTFSISTLPIASLPASYANRWYSSHNGLQYCAKTDSATASEFMHAILVSVRFLPASSTVNRNCDTSMRSIVANIVILPLTLYQPLLRLSERYCLQVL